MKLHPRADRAKFLRVRGVISLLIDRLRDWLAWRRVLRMIRLPLSAAPDVRLIVIGQSHLRSLQQAWTRGLYQPADRGWDIQFVGFHEPVVERTPEGTDVVSPVLQRQLERLGALPSVAETWIVSVVR